MVEGIKLIKCGRLIDGTGSPPVEDTSILVDGSKIKAVGKDLEVPEGAGVIDATGKTVMPGLIDSHVHNGGGVSNNWNTEMVFRPRELRLIKAIYDAKDLLASGFTMVKDCGGPNAIYLRKSAEEGTLTGIPRIVAAGLIVCQTYSTGDMHFLPTECVDIRTSKHGGRIETLLCDGVPECIKATRYALRFGADFIKISTTGGVSKERDTPADVQFQLDEIKAIVDTAAQVGKYVTAHCQNSRGAMNGILAGVKTLDHALEMNDEVIALGKEHGTIFVSTLTVVHGLIEKFEEFGMEPWVVGKAKTQLDLAIDSYQRIRTAGAILATATDLSGFPLMPLGGGANAQEFELLVKYCGFTPMETIVAATKHGAMACFMGDKTGTIEPEKFADIIVVDGNPLDDIRILQDVEKIRLVMLEGKVEVNRGL